MIPIRLDSRARSLALAALTVIAPLLPARLLAQAANNATAAASSDDASGRASNAVAALNSTFASVLGSSTKSGRWGVMVVSLSKGDTLFAENADQMLAPASTLKMYSAAIALERFGPDYAYKTPVLHDGTLGADGVIQGNVYLRGVGDPSLSDRFWKGDTPMDALARQLAERGVRRITGDVVGDATAFDDQLIPEGWKTTYLGAAYAARVSALSLNENLVWVSVKPNGKTASVTLEPASSTQPIISTVRVVAGSRGKITASRRSDGTILVRGTVGSKAPPQKYSLVVPDPPIFIAGALHAALKKAGITVDGRPRVGATPAGAESLAAVASPPLAQIVGEMNRESINVVAELMLRSAAATEEQPGSARTGLETLRQFFAQKVGTQGNVLDISDGSGLSELNRVTPRSMVELLGYAHGAPWSAAFHASLPVEGESGTLRNRGRNSPTRSNLHAKTGTTNNVASLGGYVTARNGEIIAFAFLYNGTDRWNARSAMDKMGAALADFVR